MRMVSYKKIVGDPTLFLVQSPLNLRGLDETWKYEVARDIAWPLLEAGSKAKPMTYSEALALDLILRTTNLPAKYYPTAGELDAPTPGRRLKEWTLTSMRPLGKILQPP